MHRIFHRWSAAAAAALSIILGVVAALPSAHGEATMMLADVPADNRLSVMTYNVEGLPFPVRFGRGSALTTIGERLQRLREAGRQPHIVVLQEAFSDDARMIGRLAGYRYIVAGPSRDELGAPPRTEIDRAFAADASALKGEGQGKWLNSGLMILSDYPVTDVRRMAFPTFACAGYDCLANKGAVMAVIKVPGMKTPIAVVDTHLNARKASGVSFDRAAYAYQRQVDALGDFLATNHSADMPLIVAGDFNAGQDKRRVVYLSQAAAHWGEGMASTQSSDALHGCAADPHCATSLSDDARFSLKKSRDWQFLTAGGGTILQTAHIATPFGHDADGSMLSDHIGYTAYYAEKTKPLMMASLR